MGWVFTSLDVVETGYLVECRLESVIFIPVFTERILESQFYLRASFTNMSF